MIGGIGGTGIVTIGAIVGMAAHLDGRAASVMDQIGLAQKGGEVTTHIRIAQGTDTLGPVRFAPGEADTLIGCDIAMASNPDVMPLLATDAVAVVNDHVVMTGDFTVESRRDISAGADEAPDRAAPPRRRSPISPASPPGNSATPSAPT